MSRRALLSSFSGEIFAAREKPGTISGDEDAIVEVDDARSNAVNEELEEQEETWSRLLPELLAEVVRRVESGGAERWPRRRDVVACACVCRRWRDVTRSVVRSPVSCGQITFSSSLKQVILLIRRGGGGCTYGFRVLLQGGERRSEQLAYLMISCPQIQIL